MAITSQTAHTLGSIRIVPVPGKGDLPDIPFIRLADGAERLLFGRVTFTSEYDAKAYRRTATHELSERRDGSSSSVLSELIEIHLTSRGVPTLNFVANQPTTNQFKELMALPAGERAPSDVLMIACLQNITVALSYVLSHNVHGGAHSPVVLPWMHSIADILSADSVSMEDTAPPAAPAPEAPAQHPRRPRAPIAELRAVAKVVEALVWRVPSDAELDLTANYTVPGWVLQSLTKLRVVEMLEAGDYLLWDGNVEHLSYWMPEAEFHEAFAVKNEEVPQG